MAIKTALGLGPFLIDVKGSPPGMFKKFEHFRFGYKGPIWIRSLSVRQNGDASAYDRKVGTYQIGKKGPFRLRPFRIGEMRTPPDMFEKSGTF